MSEHIPSTEEVPFPSWEAWNRIRNGSFMPSLERDRGEYESQKRFAAEHITYTKCVGCTHPFSDDNCFTQAGWQETQISGLCERCFDQVCAEDDDEDEQDEPDPDRARDQERDDAPHWAQYGEAEDDIDF